MSRLIRPEGAVEVKETLVNFVLDETGSMAECLDATISGFNEYIQALRGEIKEDTPIRMSLTKFNSNRIEIVYTNKDVHDVPLLDRKNYTPNAMTPLYDAIGQTVKFVDEEVTSKKKRKLPKIVCVVLTDGLENDSRKFTKEKITELIKKKERDGWNFVYLGANQDAWQVGIGMGMAQGNITAYTPTVDGYHKAFGSLAQDTLAYHALQVPVTKCFVSSNYEVEPGLIKKSTKFVSKSNNKKKKGWKS